MKKLCFQSTTTLEFSAPIVNHYFLLRTNPPTFGGQQIISATLEITPRIPYIQYTDSFTNVNVIGCIETPHKEFIYSISGVAEINHAKRLCEKLNSIYKYPSFYTNLSIEMMDYVRDLNLQGNDLDKSLQLADIIFHFMNYQPGTTSTSTTAIQAFASKQGVCQDYSHIFIALSRFIGIPARYANGILLGTGPSHAWVEVYVDNKWIGIDPTHNRLVTEEYIRLAVGRDFKDCALERGVFTGNAFQTQHNETRVVDRI